MRAFDWTQMGLNNIFQGVKDKQKIELFCYEKFYISENNFKIIVSCYIILELYFLINQIIVDDLIFSLMFPWFIYRSTKKIFDKYFTDRYYGEDYDNCAEEIDSYDYNLDNELFLDYLADEGYKTFYDDPRYVKKLIKRLNCVNLNHITKVRTKKSIYKLILKV